MPSITLNWSLRRSIRNSSLTAKPCGGKAPPLHKRKTAWSLLSDVRHRIFPTVCNAIWELWKVQLSLTVRGEYLQTQRLECCSVVSSRLLPFIFCVLKFVIGEPFRNKTNYSYQTITKHNDCHVCTIQTDITQLDQLHSTLLEFTQNDSTGNKEEGSCLL